MKIFYAVQATGNGHISRAMEILPHLKKYGEVDIFLSGNNSALPLAENVRYRSKGLSLFYSSSGGLSYTKIATSLTPLKIYREARDLPVEKYDLVLNDFECITSIACALKKVKSIGFGHQACFMSPYVPRPVKKNILGELVLKNYARASKYIGLHFDSYDDFILPPVIRKEIWNAEPEQRSHITVYLASYTDKKIAGYLSPIRSHHFEVFSKEVRSKLRVGNITFIPVGKDLFTKSITGCSAIITGAGFETPAEALFLGKKIMVMPIKGQYEQQCNAAALAQYGVPVLNGFTNHFREQFETWIQQDEQPRVSFYKNTRMIVSNMMERAMLEENCAYPYLAEDILWQ